MTSNPSWLDLLIGRAVRALGVPLTRRTALNFGTGFTVTDDPANDQTTITTSGGGSGGSGALVVTDLTAAKNLVRAGLTDGQTVTIKSLNKDWIWSATTGAGFAGDDKTLIQLNEGVTADAGRLYAKDGAPVVPTIAALRAAVAGVHAVVHVQAYQALADGGGGIFDFDSGDVGSADDGGRIIVAGTRRYKRRHANPIDIRWYGILPNNTAFAATNTTRFNALMALFAGNPMPTIKAPRGAYYFARGTSLNMWDLGGGRLVGDGPGNTYFQMGIDSSGSFFAAPFVSIVGCQDLRIEGIHFFARPLGTTGGVDGGGVACVNQVIKISSHTEAGADHVVCQYTNFHKCIFQGGLLAACQIGGGLGGAQGADTNIDQTSFYECRAVHTDGVGFLITDANTAMTRFTHCEFEECGSWGLQIQKYARQTKWDNGGVGNSGLLDSTKGWHFRVEAGFGLETLALLNMSIELANNNGILSVPAGAGGGDVPLGIVRMTDVMCSNNNGDMGGGHSQRIIDCRGPIMCIMSGCQFAESPVTHDGVLYFHATPGINGPRELNTKGGVLLMGGCAFDVSTNFNWDGDGVVHMTDTFDIAPTRTRTTIYGSDVTTDPTKRISGARVDPAFFNKGLQVAGSADEVQAKIIAKAGGQTSPVQTWERTGGAVISQLDTEGQAYFYRDRVPVFIGGYPAAPDNDVAMWMAVTIGTEGNANYTIFSSGANAYLNAPLGTGEVGLNAGGSGLMRWTKDNGTVIYFLSHAGDPTGTVNASHVCQICFDTTNSDMYVATATGTAGWKKFTRAP